ncbi:MAG TPA: HPr(Ser) kinase/phosphatase [Candidatus Kapabacteria bacterium]|nr:HPr(Ser) kinase/phosphatase [Candidatus Kapabacteria bacterium]
MIDEQSQTQPGWMNYKTLQKDELSVRFFYQKMKDRFKLKLVAGENGLDTKRITDKNLHRPGLALAGYVGLFTFHRLQVFGNTELYYLQSLSKEDRIRAFATLASFDIPCIVVPNGNKLPEELVAVCEERNIPTFQTPIETTKAIYLISDFLDDQFNLHTTIHGSFIDVYGVGMLFVGKSGVGKSEVTLDLVERGHRLVADDVVVVTQKGEGILMGSGTDFGEHFMEIRGLGIINVREMFGIRAIRFQKRVEVVVELEVWNPAASYTRTGLDQATAQILGVEVEHVKLPIIPGKNITVISEVISLNYLLKHYGYDASVEFTKRLDEKLARANMKKPDGNTPGERVIAYFEHDFE